MTNSFNIYRHPNTYDDQYWWKKDDIEFYKTIIKPKSIVLELGSGTGRLALPLIRNKINYYGLELSREFCKHTNNKLSKIYTTDKIIHGNMINFKLDYTFDYIFVAFNTFLHVLNNSDANSSFKCIKDHLKPNGKFILDILMPNPMFLYRNKIDDILIMDFKDSSNGNIVEIYETISYNAETEICNIKWTYKHKDKSLDKIFNYNMRMYHPDTINRLLIDNYFAIDAVYGDYNMNKFDENSALQIYICR